MVVVGVDGLLVGVAMMLINPLGSMVVLLRGCNNRLCIVNLCNYRLCIDRVPAQSG